MPRRVLILANPIAGGGKGERLARELQRELEARDSNVELFLTAKGGDAGARAAALASDPEPVDAVVVVGGDGTVNEVLNGLPDPATPLAVLPVGTANVLASELRLPRRPVAAARAIAAGRTVRAAIGLVNGRRFLLFTSIGMDGAIVRRLSQVRKGTLGKWRWAGPIGHVIRTWPQFHLTVTLEGGDGPRTLTDLSQVLVTRVRNYGGTFSLPRPIDITDGLLHVLAFRQRSRWAWFRASLRALCGRLRPGRDLEHLTCTSITVHPTTPGADAPAQVDGDFFGSGPVDIALHDRAARLMVP